MTTHKETLTRIARDDTEHGKEYYLASDVDALLAQPEQIQPSAYSNTHQPEQEPDEVDIRSRLYQRIHELETQLEQPKEPDSMRVYVENFATKVGWVKGSMEGAFEYIQRKSYAQGLEDATPPQRTWVGLTDEEIYSIDWKAEPNYARAVEAKLKEKNT